VNSLPESPRFTSVEIDGPNRREPPPAKAASLRHEDVAVIVFRSGGAGCPFFFLADITGSASPYEHLAARISPLHSAYGLNAGSCAAASEEVTVESIAANHVAEIERLAPPGKKVVLVGYSFGGTVAFEVASQLRARGMVDPLPVIIDMSALNAPGVQASPKQLDVLSNLPAWIAHEAAHFHLRAFLLRCYGNCRRMWRAMAGRTQREELDPLIYFGQPSLPHGLQKVVNAMYRAMCTYIPKRYEGKVVLLRAKVPNLFRTRDPAMGWETLAAGGVEVHPIPGRHDNCMSELHNRDLAATLASCAAAFESGAPAPL
jgi:thioesterase domain-containing protein